MVAIDERPCRICVYDQVIDLKWTEYDLMGYQGWYLPTETTNPTKKDKKKGKRKNKRAAEPAAKEDAPKAKRVRIAAEPKAPAAPVRTSPRRLAKKGATDGAGPDVPGPEQQPAPATTAVAAVQDDAMEVDVVGDDAPAPEPVQATPKASAKKGGGAKKAAPKKPAAKRKAAAPKKRAPKGGPKGQRTKKAAPAAATIEQPAVDTTTVPSPQHESAPDGLLAVPVAEFTFRVPLTSSPEPSPTSTAVPSVVPSASSTRVNTPTSTTPLTKGEARDDRGTHGCRSGGRQVGTSDGSRNAPVRASSAPAWPGPRLNSCSMVFVIGGTRFKLVVAIPAFVLLGLLGLEDILCCIASFVSS